MQVTDFLEFVQNKDPPAPKFKLWMLEASLGTKLPEDYRSFLIACNGGWVGGALWFTGPTPKGESADAGVHHVGGIRQEDYLSLDWSRRCYRGRIPDTMMWIMDDPFGNAICLGLKGAERGKIYFWDHECEPDEDWDGRLETAGNLQLLANSFTEFVAGLAEPENEEIQ